MTLPVVQEINRKRGDTKPLRFTLKDSSDADQPLAGYSFLFTVNSERKPVDNTNQQFSISANNDSDGNFSFSPSAANVDLIGTYYYDVEMTTPGGIIYTLYEGKIKFTQDITK